jgi:aminopeptidase N
MCVFFTVYVFSFFTYHKPSVVVLLLFFVAQLEYDLDLYNIVAVDNFNMGAMENKSLNIFNTAYVLADETTATDTDFERVEAVIAHEYFHNWTGNRVTCRTYKQRLLVWLVSSFVDAMSNPLALVVSFI